MKFLGFARQNTLLHINGVLFAAIVVSSGYITYSVLTEKNYFYEAEILDITRFSESSYKKAQRKQKDYSLFLQQIKNRNIFASPQRRSSAPAAGIDRTKINKIIENLQLVGVIAGEEPKVVIEDKKAQKSFYLKEGESFSENIIVEKIEKNSVLINCYGETFELYL